VWSCSREVQRYCLLALKVFDHIGDGGEAIDSTEFAIYFFDAETIAHGGTRFDCLEFYSWGSHLDCHRGQCMRALHVNAWRGGEIKND
jgi:hypothetical protein